MWMPEMNTSLSFKLTSQLNACLIHNPPHLVTFGCDTILPMFKAFETASFGRLRGKHGAEDHGEVLLDIWDKQTWQDSGHWWWGVSVSCQSPFARVPPEDGIVVEQGVESTVNNECLTSDDLFSEIRAVRLLTRVGKSITMG
jgi:hypothetical protein